MRIIIKTKAITLKSIIAFLPLFCSIAYAVEGLAVINVEAAITQTEYYKKIAQGIEETDDYIDLRKRYEALVAQSRGIEEEVRRDGDLMTEEELKTRRDSLAGNQSELELLGQRIQNIINRTNETVLRDLGPLIESSSNDLITAYKIKVVIPATQVIWFDPALDLTLELSKAIDRKIANGALEQSEEVSN